MGVYGSPDTHPKLINNQRYNNSDINQNSSFEPIKCPHCGQTIYVSSRGEQGSGSKSIKPSTVFKYTLAICGGIFVAFILIVLIFSFFAA